LLKEVAQHTLQRRRQGAGADERVEGGDYTVDGEGCVWVALVGFEGEKVDKGEAAEAEGRECVERERTAQTTPQKFLLSLSLSYLPTKQHRDP
jgi:hypothetical protein